MVAGHYENLAPRPVGADCGHLRQQLLDLKHVVNPNARPLSDVPSVNDEWWVPRYRVARYVNERTHHVFSTLVIA
jgi:hypothetical protein